VTFVMSTAGVHIGTVAGALIGKRAEVAGGLVLIGIGTKILIEHLFFGG
jgi:manganese efflux pump family protein